MLPELARKLQERRSVVETEGNAWETKPEVSSADARGEQLLVDGIVDDDGEDLVWASPRNDEFIFVDKIGGYIETAAAQCPTTARVVLDGAAAKPSETSDDPMVVASSSVTSSSVTSSARSSCQAEFERIQRERMAWASDCARRWPALLRGNRHGFTTNEADFAHVCEADLRVIRADVQRTRVADPAFQSPEARERLISSITRFCKEEGIRYLQGLHEVAAVFLFVALSAPDGVTFGEEEVIACLASATHRFTPYFHDGDAFVALHVSLLFFRQLILYHHPDLHNFLADAGVSPLLYATPWFITLFASRTPLSVVLQLWDRYFARGDASFLPFLAVATLAAEKTAICATQKDDIHSVVVKVGIKSLERLDLVWDAAELLQRRTPQSFSLRLSRVLAAVLEKSRLPKPAEKPWSERVLDRVAKERYFSILPGEIITHLARRLGESHAASGSEMSSLDSRQAAQVQQRSNEDAQGNIAKDAPGTKSIPIPNEPTPGASGKVAEPVASRKLCLMLLDLRGKEEFESGHLPHAVHFDPPCLGRLKAGVTRGGRASHIDKLAAVLKDAVGGALSGLLAGQVPSLSSLGPSPVAQGTLAAAPPDNDLLSEFFSALHASVAPQCGEAWLSDSNSVHVILLGGAPDSSESVAARCDANTVNSNVAVLYEALTEHLSLPRVSVALGGAVAVQREALRRNLQLSQGAAQAVPTATPDAAAGLVESAALFGSNAWSRLRGASEALPAVDGMGAHFEGLLRSGAEVARSSAQVAARGIAEGVTVVRQQAVESAGIVRQQAEVLTVVRQRFDKEPTSGVTEPQRTEYVAGSEISTSFQTLSELQPHQGSMRGTRNWTCNVLLPAEHCATPMEWPQQPAILCLMCDGRLIISSPQGSLASFDGMSHPLGSFCARSLLRIGSSPTTPQALSFYFTGCCGAPQAMDPPSSVVATSGPAFLAIFDDAATARSCAKAVAGIAAAAKKQCLSRSEASSVDMQSIPVVANSETSPPAPGPVVGEATHVQLAPPVDPDVAPALPAPSSASMQSPWDDIDEFLLELEQLSGTSDPNIAARTDLMDTDAFFRELDELAGIG